MRKGMWAFFLDCGFRLLIGWADKLRSRGGFWNCSTRKCVAVAITKCQLLFTAMRTKQVYDTGLQTLVQNQPEETA